MFYITKSFEVSCAYKLYLDYESEATQLQGDTLVIEITCGGNEVNTSGMLIDFDSIQREVLDMLDHKYLNDVLRNINPTLENLAKWVCEQVDTLCEIGYCIRVAIHSADNAVAIYENDLGSTNLAKSSHPNSQYITH